MTYKVLRQATLALVILSSTALVLSTGIVGSTLAIFNGETQNAASSFAGGWIDAPSALTAGASGYDVALGWTPGTHGPVTGQTLNGVNNGTNSNCTGAAYAFVATLGSAIATYTDSSRGNAGNNGNWFCYQLVSTSATVWTAQASKPLQVGLATTGIAIANVGTDNSVDAGDTITLTFNQKTNLAASGSLKVCVARVGHDHHRRHRGRCGCMTRDAIHVGVITGVTIGTSRLYGGSTFTARTSAPWTTTITLVGGGTSTYSGTATFTPSASILSAATTHQAHVHARDVDVPADHDDAFLGPHAVAGTEGRRPDERRPARWYERPWLHLALGLLVATLAVFWAAQRAPTACAPISTRACAPPAREQTPHS